jgi:HSP20 family molecular chaperone IbpA
LSSESRKTNRDEPAVQPETHTFHTSGWNVAAACIEPLYNLFVGPSEVVITVDLPYVNQTQVKLQCPSDDTVEIYAETNRKITFKDLGAKHRHGEFTCYHSRIRIPVPVDENRISSKFKRGVLEVHLPRVK